MWALTLDPLTPSRQAGAGTPQPLERGGQGVRSGLGRLFLSFVPLFYSLGQEIETYKET